MVSSLVLVFAALWFIDPVKAKWLPVCPFHALTGLYCPGCGSLRCLHELAHGHLGRAMTLNPLTVMAVPVLLYSLAVELRGLFSSEPAKRIAPTNLAYWVVSVIIIAFGIVRNIPAYPLTLLAPR